MKKPTTKNTRTLVKSAIRKIWKIFPPRIEALKNACENPSAKTHDRKYLCAFCWGSFFLQQVEVNHKVPANSHESLDYFTERILLDVVSWKGDTFNLKNGTVTTANALAQEYLEVLCKNCHKIKTKEQNKLRKELAKKLGVQE